MFSFLRKRKETPVGTAATFVEATGGGWSDVPDAIASDGGAQADFVGLTLDRARTYALEHDIPVGKEFEFRITDIPLGISSPHEIVFGLMMRAQDYGLRSGIVTNETALFTRLK